VSDTKPCEVTTGEMQLHRWELHPRSRSPPNMQRRSQCGHSTHLINPTVDVHAPPFSIRSPSLRLRLRMGSNASLHIAPLQTVTEMIPTPPRPEDNPTTQHHARLLSTSVPVTLCLEEAESTHLVHESQIMKQQ